MSEILKKICEDSSFLYERSLEYADKVKPVYSRELEDLFFDDRICTSDGKTLLFADSFYPGDFYKIAKRQFDKLGICHRDGFFGLYLMFFDRSFELCEKIGLDEKILEDTLCVVLKNFYESCDDFFDYIFCANYVRLSFLRIGGFDFQHTYFTFEKCVRIGTKVFDKKQRAVLLHIPEKCDLSEKSRLCAYSLCREIFGPCLLVCNSWLLYPEHRKMLGKGSNILSFCDDFEIANVYETYDYTELFHVFGKGANYKNVPSLPCWTSLQKAYIGRIEKALPVGSAIGIRYIE